MKKYDFYCGLFFLILALFVIGISLRLGLGDLRHPKPGFFPFLVGLLLFSLTIGMMVLVCKERAKDRAFRLWPSFSGNVTLTLAVLFAYAVSLEFLGYLLGSFLLFLYLFKCPARKKWFFSLWASAVIVLLTYYFFGVLLKSQFPRGILNVG